MGCAVMQGGRFADAQELHFQDAKHSDMGRAVQKGIDMLMLRKGAFSLLNIWIL